MLSHYTAIVFIIAISMLIMIVSVKGNKFMPVKNRNNFILLFTLLIIVNLAEWLAESINGGDAGLRPLHIASKFAEFLLAPVIPAVCAAALGGDRIGKIFKIFIGINVLLQVLSLFNGIIFTIDAGNVYHRSMFYAAYVAIAACCTFLLLVHSLRFSSRYQYQNIVFLILIILLVLAAMTSQMIFSYLRLDWVCVSIAAIMFYIYYDQLVQQIDTLTTLLNRRSYECQVEQLKKTADVLFLDVDSFKEINDTYGHGYGDECLFVLAKKIKQVFGKHGYCYRYGGDEFCVVKTDKEVSTQDLIGDYLAGITELRRKDGRLPRVSIGYATYHPNEESIQDAIARADAMMYKYKELHHQSRYNLLA